MKLLRIVGVLVVIGLIAAGAGALFVMNYKDSLIAFAGTPHKQDIGDEVWVTIPKGAGPQQIAKILEDQGVIGDQTLFYRYLRFVAKKQGALKAGEYELSPKMTPDQIIALLEVGKPPEVR